MGKDEANDTKESSTKKYQSTAWKAFVSEESQGKQFNSDTMKELSKRWANLSEEEKGKYRTIATVAKVAAQAGFQPFVGRTGAPAPKPASQPDESLALLHVQEAALTPRVSETSGKHEIESSLALQRSNQASLRAKQKEWEMAICHAIANYEQDNSCIEEVLSVCSDFQSAFTPALSGITSGLIHLPADHFAEALDFS